MSGNFRKKIFISTIYLLFSAAICWQGFYLYKYSRSAIRVDNLRPLRVRVDGNVRKPGLYQISEGTTQFEILKVAGIRPTSDISGFNLTSMLEDNETVNVGTLENAIDIQPDKPAVRLEFFLGEIGIFAGDGRETPKREGMSISKGDRILTGLSSQAEVSVGSNSRIDMDGSSELVFDKTGETENNRNIVELFQKSGICWYRIVYSRRDSELFRVITQSTLLTAGASGADFLVDIQNDHIQISLMDGLVLLERIDKSEAVNLISGQSVIIYKDGRPFETSRLSSGLNVNERFSKLSQEKSNYRSQAMPFNLLFCGTPAIFYVISIQYETGDFHLTRIPPELLIEQFSQGISTLDQAYLYGGPVFVSTFLERLLDIRIPKYCVLDKYDIIRMAEALGGVQLNIDFKAASALNLTQGSNKLTGNNLVQYLSPSISGTDDCYRRQSHFIESIFSGFRNKKLSLSLLLAEQILTNTETNLFAFEMMEQYGKFNTRSNWNYREHNIPALVVKRGNRNCLEPILEKSKDLLKVK